ncbi:MAG: hypothetical protein PW843_28050 [Azospirillaceae bacterium]|nr:hypothetical protein [Azospirillaceae bacterium]
MEKVPVVFGLVIAAGLGGYLAILLRSVVSLTYGLLSVLLSLIMAALPIAICLVQTKSKDRTLKKLLSLSDEPVAKSTYYRIAKISVGAINPVALGSDYLLPIIVLFSVTSVSFISMYFSLDFNHMLEIRNPLLGGARMLTTTDPLEIKAYQEGTFTVGAMAFIGAYVYMLYRLLDRTNNNDIYPISLYYYAARIPIATLIAAVLRQSIPQTTAELSVLLPLLGFVVGLAPDLFLVTMTRRAFQFIKVFGVKDDPPVEARPPAMPLLMLNDLSRDKIDRLQELGIDSAQVLACQNPFIIWPRLPYDLGLIVDWIAAAQLYALLGAAGLEKARARYVTDIFDLHLRLGKPAAATALCQTLDLTSAEAEGLVAQLEADQSFTRLREVRDQLRPESRDAAHGDDLRTRPHPAARTHRRQPHAHVDITQVPAGVVITAVTVPPPANPGGL